MKSGLLVRGLSFAIFQAAISSVAYANRLTCREMAAHWCFQAKLAREQ